MWRLSPTRRYYKRMLLDASAETRGDPPIPLGPLHRGKPRRWVVERTGSWHNRFRGLLIRWERKAAHYEANVQLASALIALQQAT